ncbi:Ger(x)C family spore germination protein [Alkaliphilus peptidifermentans]|uniref:Germination protein, Ger(X)C family n=1 Tax=Alkaliphilus peptidifermentans DSM 18978 TaxID=1120976 RepID=A0A1G5KHL9_9FIRM|nr:Ger(x)C family spore germination protein [Alkaliphilus peptidifermentans]SCZ00066.1 germination protein, Ger(x)C family [Alkaliphilus peptidifermentans DSM 18978]
MRKKILLLSLLIFSISLTACWDSVEIDDRTFILAIGVDVYHPEEDDGNIDEERQYYPEHHRPAILATFVAPKALAGGGGEIEVENVSMSSVAHSAFLARNQMVARSDDQLFLGHLKTLLIGEELAQNPMLLREVLDRIEKDALISRRISLAVVDGMAKEALEVQPKLEPMTGQFINDLFKDQARTNRAPIADVGEILISLHRNSNALIPRLVYSEDEIKVGGGAVIKNYKMVGWIGEMESIAYMIITDNLTQLGLNHHMDYYIIPYSITDLSTSMELQENNENIKIIISVTGEGDIEGLYFNPEDDVLDPSFVEKVQEGIGQDIKELLVETIDVFQNEYQVDVLGFDEYLKKYKPGLWREVREDWDDIFPLVEVEVEVDIFIRRVGLSR